MTTTLMYRRNFEILDCCSALSATGITHISAASNNATCFFFILFSSDNKCMFIVILQKCKKRSSYPLPLFLHCFYYFQGTYFFTVILHVTVCFPDCTVIVTVPGFKAVTVPSLLTFTISVSELL